MVGGKTWISLALSLAILVVVAEAEGFCGTARNKKLCEEVVKGATDWNQAMTKAITEAMNHLQKLSNSDFRSTIHQAKSAAAASNVERECTESYTYTREKLKESLEALHSGDKDGSLNFKLSGALTSLEDCTNILQDFKVDMSSLVAASRDIDQAIRVALAVDKSKPGQ